LKNKAFFQEISSQAGSYIVDTEKDLNALHREAAKASKSLGVFPTPLKTPSQII
jgi:hypothetical protein